ncbi:tyrosine-protein phosphatase [Pedobacter sp. UBA5917]|jgi:protein-tyrosine phosphatase|uniref:tyrosine-protein phosphatase n=1 Tax=Pedobacter sp. UBA5917 TaxID=1947061 RepID=UPI0025E6C88A|nr:tyrosine-protein phosphatase [Pedobacter sp. UBA5917]
MKNYLLTGILILLTANLFAQVADSAMRKVNLQGAVNFRDAGGYSTKDGRHVKWRKVYRSADLSKLTDADLAELKARKITFDVDLRGHQEAATAPDKLNPNTDYILCPAGSDSLNTITRDLAAHKNADSIMMAFYGNTRYLADRYKPFFNKLLSLPDDQSLVFHCTAGKDRTGMGAALFLYSLGVPYQTIVDDYTASNYYRRAESQKAINAMVSMMHIDPQSAKSLMDVKKAYLDATFTAINKQYGSVDQFLKNQIGLSERDIETLKSKYLQ